MPSSSYRFRNSTISAGIVSVLREEQRVQSQRRRQQGRSRFHRRRERQERRQQLEVTTTSPPPPPTATAMLPPVTPELMLGLTGLDPPVLPVDIAPHLLSRAGDDTSVLLAVREAMDQLHQLQMTTRVMDALEWLAELNVIFEVPIQPPPPAAEATNDIIDIEEWIRQQRQEYIDREYVAESFYQALQTDIAGDSDICGICFDDYTEASSIRIFDCNHAFDRECIDQWLVTTGSSECPMCHSLIIPDEI